MKINTPTLSVVMPALNEERNIMAAISSTLNAFQKHGIDGEIIVVNDGSTDGTREIVESVMRKNPAVTVINHEKPAGIGFSFFEGALSSKKDVVVMFPGDNENNPDDALAFFDMMDRVDIIVPFIHNIEVRDKKRRLISSVYRFIINMSFGINLNYTNGTVFYRRSILDGITLNSSGFFYQAELLIKLIRKGYMFVEVPNFLSTRACGVSKATTFGSLFKVIKNYLKLVFDIHIKRVETRSKDYRKLNAGSVSFQKCSGYDRKA